MIPFLAPILGVLLALKRKCPKCGRDQIGPRDKQYENVKCKFCGVQIPPKKR